MLDGYGLHQLVWDAADERFGDVLVASPADAGGRGISLAVRQNGAAANLTGASVYLVWRHKMTGERGTELFTPVSAAAGTFEVYYPAAMQEAEGAVQAQVMVSCGDDTYISSRVFTIRVEPVIVGGEEHEDGFTLFVDAINAYEHATEITTDAADAANAAATAANNAASNATSVAEGIQAAVQRGDYDGADGFSPVATVTQTAEGATISITDVNGTTTANVAKGAKGDKGDTGEQGPKGDTGERGPQGVQGETGPKGDKGDTGATGAQGPKGDTGETGATGATGPQGPKGDKGDTGATGAQGPQGIQGEAGPKGEIGAAGSDGIDGVSCTHSWNGTVLSVTSASGTSSADLMGPQGPTGATGATGPQGPAGADGADGTVFTPQSPLALSNGVLSVDLTGYAEDSDLPPKLWFGSSVPSCPENGVSSKSVTISLYPGLRVGDYMLSTTADTLVQVTSISQSGYSTYVGVKGVMEFPKIRGFIPTTDIDLAAGVTGTADVDVWDHAVHVGTILLNTTSGNLMRVNSSVNSAGGYGFKVSISATGLGNIYNANVSGGATYTAASPLSIDANDEISIDLTGYAALAGATFTGAVSGIAPTANAHFATKKYVDDAIAALDDLSGVSF